MADRGAAADVEQETPLLADIDEHVGETSLLKQSLLHGVNGSTNQGPQCTYLTSVVWEFARLGVRASWS